MPRTTRIDLTKDQTGQTLIVGVEQAHGFGEILFGCVVPLDGQQHRTRITCNQARVRDQQGRRRVDQDNVILLAHFLKEQPEPFGCKQVCRIGRRLLACQNVTAQQRVLKDGLLRGGVPGQNRHDPILRR